MKYDKKIVIVGIIVLVILSVFLTIKYNCEKLHQDILMYGDKDVSAVYLVNSKIRKDNLYLDIIGPISKGNVFIDSDINIEIKDNLGTTIGKSLIKDSEIFNTSGKHITFSAMIPNITWKDRLAGIKIEMILSEKYINNYCINNDMSNIKLYYKGEKTNNNTKDLNWVKYQLWSQGLSYEGLIDAFNVIKNTKIKNKTELEKALTAHGVSDYSKFFSFDAQNNIKVYINDIPIDINKIQGESENVIKDSKNGIFHKIKQTLFAPPKPLPNTSYLDKL